MRQSGDVVDAAMGVVRTCAGSGVQSHQPGTDRTPEPAGGGVLDVEATLLHLSYAIAAVTVAVRCHEWRLAKCPNQPDEAGDVALRARAVEDVRTLSCFAFVEPEWWQGLADGKLGL